MPSSLQPVCILSNLARHTQVDRLPVFYKQRTEGLHPAWAYTLPITFLRIFYSLTEAGIWSVIVYWLVGFAPDAGRCVCEPFMLLIYASC